MKRPLFFLSLLVVLAALLAAQLRLETRLTVFFLGLSEESVFVLSRLQQSLFARRYLLSIEAHQANSEELAVFTHELVQALQRLHGVSRVWSASDKPMAVTELLERYADHAEVIYSLDPPHDAPQLFDPGLLPQRAVRLKELLLSPYGHWIQNIVRRDPLLLTFHALQDWRDLFRPRETQDLQMLFVETAFDAFAIEDQRQLQQDMAQILAAIGRHPRICPQSTECTQDDLVPQFHIHMTGVPVFAVQAQQRIQNDVNRVSLASTLGVLAVFLLLFRTPRSLLATAMVLAFAGTSGAIATQWTFGYVHGLTLALGATLIGICVDYPIHVLAHCHPGNSAYTVVRNLWPAMLMGGVTTLIGYLALGATGYPGFQQIAVFATTGIVVALLTTRFVLPAFVPGVGLRMPQLPPLAAWRRFCGCQRRLLRIFGVVVVIASVAFIPRLRWLDDLERLAVIDPELKHQDRLLRARFGGIEPGRAVMIHAKDMETALQRAETATRILRRLKKEGRLATFQPVYPWLVSHQLQQRNWQYYRALVTRDFVVTWRRALETAGLAVVPLSQLYREAPVWLEKPDPLLDAILPGQIVRREGGVDLAIWLGTHDPGALRDALVGLPGIRYFSQHDHINALARRYRQRALQSLGVGLTVIVLLLGLRYRSLVIACQILAPAALGMLTILACLAVAGHPLNFFHLLAALLAVAICVDYAIFYRECRGGNLTMTYRAMGASMLTTVTAFAALGLASNPVFKTLSLAVTVGVVSGFLWCPVLVCPVCDERNS